MNRLKSWLIERLGGLLPEPAQKGHRYSVETRYSRYYADKVKLHQNGTVEWWSDDPAWGKLHRILTEREVEITDHAPEGADEHHIRRIQAD